MRILIYSCVVHASQIISQGHLNFMFVIVPSTCFVRPCNIITFKKLTMNLSIDYQFKKCVLQEDQSDESHRSAGLS